MSRGSLTVLVTVVVLGCLAPGSASGQNQGQSDTDGTRAWTPPRTPDGRPDLQGYWTTQTFTPLERPEHLAAKEFFTEEEAAALHQQLTAEGVDPSARDAVNIGDPEAREKRLYQTNRDASYVHVRQRALAAHAGAKGSVKPTNVTDHGSARWASPAHDAGSPAAGGRRPRGEAATWRL